MAQQSNKIEGAFAFRVKPAFTYMSVDFDGDILFHEDKPTYRTGWDDMKFYSDDHGDSELIEGVYDTGNLQQHLYQRQGDVWVLVEVAGKSIDEIVKKIPG